MKTTQSKTVALAHSMSRTLVAAVALLATISANATMFNYEYDLIFQNETGVPATDFHIEITWPNSITIELPLDGTDIDTDDLILNVFEFDADDDPIGVVFDGADADASFTGGSMPNLTLDLVAGSANPVVNPMNQILVSFAFRASRNNGVISDLYWTNSGLITDTNPDGRIPGDKPKILSLSGGVRITEVPEPALSLLFLTAVSLVGRRGRSTRPGFRLTAPSTPHPDTATTAPTETR